MSDNPILETAETEQTPTVDPNELENQQPAEGAEKVDEPAQAEESEEEVAHYIELDGKEYDLEEVKVWKNGHMMQADYTRKTTEHARTREKDLEEIKVEREKLSSEKAKVTELQDKLQALVMEDEGINWAELKEDDLETYVELKEKADNRKKLLEEIQAKRSTPTDDPALIETERAKLFSYNPNWVDKDGNFTDDYTNDIKLMDNYAAKSGFSADEYAQLTKASMLNTLLKAAKYDSLKEESRKISDKREKIPVVTKPKAKQTKVQSKSVAEAWFPDLS